MDVMEAIHTRRAVREFSQQSIDRGAIERLIDAAVWAPSAVNEQPWHFTVIRDRGKLDAISNDAKAHLLATPEAAVAGDLRDTLREPHFHIFYHAPVLILVTAVRNGPWAVEDCALAAENLMLAARAEGLGTCWIGFAQRWLQTDEGKHAVGLPAASLPVAPIVVGHCPSMPPAVPRKPPQIHWIG